MGRRLVDERHGSVARWQKIQWPTGSQKGNDTAPIDRQNDVDSLAI